MRMEHGFNTTLLTIMSGKRDKHICKIMKYCTPKNYFSHIFKQIYINVCFSYIAVLLLAFHMEFSSFRGFLEIGKRLHFAQEFCHDEKTSKPLN